MSNRQDGRAVVYLGPDSSAVISGNEDITTWDDEELLYGRRRDKNGKFAGKAPKVVPVQFFNEFKRRQIFGAESALTKALPKAAEYLAAVATGDEEAQPGRLRACESLLDRGLGKPVDRIQMSARVDMELNEPPWLAALQRSLLIDGVPANEHPLTRDVIPATSRAVEPDDEIIDAEIVEEESESGLSDQCAREAHGVCPECECVCHIRPTPEPTAEIIWEEDDDEVLTDD